MTYSKLADGLILSDHYTPYRYEVTRITPHHTASIATAAQIAAVFKNTDREASCNYAIGNDGSIVCCVPEEYRAWTSSSFDNDMRSITVEISDCNYDWEISDVALEAYINLCVDLIQRYPSLGGSYRWTGDFSGNITEHRWFASTYCCGDYLEGKQDYIMQEVNRRLSGETEDEEVKPEDIGAIVNAITFKGEPFNGKGMYYKGHIENIGWDGNFLRDGQIIGTEGQSLRLEAINFMPPRDIKMKASAYIEGKGWVDYDIPAAGGVVGTEGEGLRIEALKLDADVPLRYRAHVSNIGWQEWKSNGEEAGRVGERIEAFQLVLA